MIEYKKLESGTPSDVELVTDDADCEMAALEEIIKQGEFELSLPEKRGEDDRFHVIIPGAMVGEFSEFTYDVDGGQLENLTDKWNREALDASIDDKRNDPELQARLQERHDDERDLYDNLKD